MVHAPESINITIDEDALRKQVQAVIEQATKEASFALRRAADALDPTFMDMVHEGTARHAVDQERARVAREAAAK